MRKTPQPKRTIDGEKLIYKTFGFTKDELLMIKIAQRAHDHYAYAFPWGVETVPEPQAIAWAIESLLGWRGQADESIRSEMDAALQNAIKAALVDHALNMN